jgi:hypothetical protein
LVASTGREYYLALAREHYLGGGGICVFHLDIDLGQLCSSFPGNSLGELPSEQ